MIDYEKAKCYELMKMLENGEKEIVRTLGSKEVEERKRELVKLAR